MPLSLLEAMSYGNCCLTSDIKECSEVLGEKGVTFKKSNVKELTKQISKLCSCEKDVENYKENAQEYILERYNWDNVVKQTLKCYDAIKIQKLEKKHIIVTTIIILLLLQNFLQRFIGAFKYYDEIFVVLSMFALPKFTKEKKYKINKYDKIILYSMLSMIAIGCLGNLIFKYQVIRFVIADLIVFSKFIIAFTVSSTSIS